MVVADFSWIEGFLQHFNLLLVSCFELVIARKSRLIRET